MRMQPAGGAAMKRKPRLQQHPGSILKMGKENHLGTEPRSRKAGLGFAQETNEGYLWSRRNISQQNMGIREVQSSHKFHHDYTILGAGEGEVIR